MTTNMYVFACSTAPINRALLSPALTHPKISRFPTILILKFSVTISRLSDQFSTMKTTRPALPSPIPRLKESEITRYVHLPLLCTYFSKAIRLSFSSILRILEHQFETFTFSRPQKNSDLSGRSLFK
ncbi:hypothetical protein OCU04_011587 [Sclerotinia nivalis]|uniref:Uncharacterized protein n=1 Tax=Sclerotinia nivalis TaxID=352851 RepID=A0A9X0DGL0_9HELO|nr:hypothetical protein OCU04_011587 [Sclerotinia nivalis]